MNTIWPNIPIGQLCELINGRAFKPEDWGTNGLPIIRIQNLNDDKKPYNYFAGSYAEKHFVRPGDILLSWSGTPGTSFGCFKWNRSEGLLNQHIFNVKVRQEIILPDFFMHGMNFKLDEMIDLAHGAAGLRHITKGKLEQIEMPVPSIQEQHRVLSLINECLERVLEIKALREGALKEAQAVFPSVLAKSFDELAANYQDTSIANVTIETRYGTSRNCTTTEEGIPVLRIPNVAAGVVNTDNLKFCTLNAHEMDSLQLLKGDILIVRTNGSPDLVGRCAVFDIPEPLAKSLRLSFVMFNLSS